MPSLVRQWCAVDGVMCLTFASGSGAFHTRALLASSFMRRTACALTGLAMLRQVCADASIVFPLLVSQTFAKKWVAKE